MELAVQHYNLFPTRIWLAKRHGMGALFAHWVGHYVGRHGNNLPRVAISFNAIAK